MEPHVFIAHKLHETSRAVLFQVFFCHSDGRISSTRQWLPKHDIIGSLTAQYQKDLSPDAVCARVPIACWRETCTITQNHQVISTPTFDILDIKKKFPEAYKQLINY